MNWRVFQSGVGIDLSDGSFRAVLVRRQWNRVRAVDRLEIPQYRQVSPQECGKLYREFLRKNGLQAPWTVVALPRSAVLLRSLSFPQAVAKELARAVEYELDALHPFEEGSVYWDFASWKSPEKKPWNGSPAGQRETDRGRIDLLVAITEKQTVDTVAAWFQQAGIPVSQFTVTTSSLFGMFWFSSAGKDRNWPAFFLLHCGSQTLELIGHALRMPLVSKEIPMAGAPDSEAAWAPAVERELAAARSELRLEPEMRAPLILCGKSGPVESAVASSELPFTTLPLEELFPSWSSDPDGFNLRENAVAFSAALAAIDRSLPFAFNLLPAERRSYQSPVEFLPTYALSALVVLLALALGARGSLQDWLYNRYLEREIQAMQPRVQQVERLQEQARNHLERVALLARFRDSSAVSLEVLSELTRLLPQDAWLQQMQYEGNTLSFSGEAQSASGLLQIFSGSEYFESPQFSSAISRNQQGKEVFRIGVRLRGAPR